MIRLSLQARQALAKLTLPVLILASFALMLLGKADALLAEHARTTLADGLAPIYAAAAGPLERLHRTIAEVGDLWTCAKTMSGCVTRMNGCGAGSQSLWRSMPKSGD